MNPELEIGLFVALFVFFLGGIGSGIGAYVHLIERVKALETIFSMMSDNAAKILHSPHTPELDGLLEDLRRTYVEDHFELSPKDWQRLFELCTQTENDTELPKGERFMAAWVSTLCRHKLKMIPPDYSRIL